MKFVIKDQPDWIGQWVADQVGFEYISGRMQAIGWVEDGEVLAGVVVYDWTGTNCFMHVAASPNREHGDSHDYIVAIFKYIFVQLGCLRCSGWVPADNSAALKLDQWLGFEQEFVMKDGGSDGDHILMVMWRDKCRWIQE